MTAKLLWLPFKLAVTFAVASAEIVPAVAANVAVVAPLATATVPGTPSPALSLDRLTVAPPVFETVTVQVALAPEPRLAGVQLNPVTVTGAVSVTAKLLWLPFKLAVTFAVASVEIVPAVTANVAVVAPLATATVPGTPSPALSLDRLTVAPPVFETVTVQVALAPEPRLAGVQLNPVTVAGAVSVTAKLLWLPFKLAVTFAVASAETVPAVAANVAVVAPLATATVPGTPSPALSLDRLTVAPPVFETVTVQVALAPEPRLAGVQLNPVTVTGAVSVTAKLLWLPFKLAVTFAVASAEIVPAVAANVAVVAPLATATVPGTPSPALSLDRLTVAPPVFETVTVQVALAPEPRLAGVQLNPVTVTGAVSVTAKLLWLPFKLAVTFAVASAEIVSAVAANVAVVAPLATATVPGTPSPALSLDRLTVAPPVFETVTVQVALAPEPRLAGVQLNPVTVTGAVNVTAKLLWLPFKLAVTFAVASAETVPAVAANVAVVAPLATATVPGTPSPALSLDRLTVAPPVFETVTVQVAAGPRAQAGRRATQSRYRHRRRQPTAKLLWLPFKLAVTFAVASAEIVPAVAANVAVVAPLATATVPGTPSPALSLDRLTVAPPVFETVTVQVALAPEPRLAGVQLNPVTVTGAVNVTAKLLWLPFKLAVTFAVASAKIVPAVAANVAVVAPLVTATVPGTPSPALSLDRLTVAPPVFETVTVQAAPAPEPRLAGVQLKPVTVTGSTRFKVTDWDTPPKLAVSLPEPSATNAFVATANETELAPAGTSTEAGGFNAALSLVSGTVTPPIPAEAVRLTVQVVELDGPTESGLQLTVLSATGCSTAMTPPVAVAPIPLASSDTPRAFVTPIFLVPADAVTVTLATATTPFEITLWLIPVSMHV